MVLSLTFMMGSWKQQLRTTFKNISVPSKKRRFEDEDQENQDPGSQTHVCHQPQKEKPKEVQPMIELMKKMSEAMMIMLQQSFKDVRMKI